MTKAAERNGSVLILVISTIYLVVATQLPNQSPNLSDMGPRVYPLVLGILATLLSAIWVAQALKRSDDGPATGEDADLQFSQSWKQALLLVIVATIFPVLLMPLGFVATATIVLFALSGVIIWRRLKVRNIIVTAIFAVVCAFGLEILLTDVMAIYLP